MNLAMDGKKIEHVFWPDTDGASGINISDNDDTEIELSATHHGDHDEFWIIQYGFKDGVRFESARHSPRYVETIVWKVAK